MKKNGIGSLVQQTIDEKKMSIVELAEKSGLSAMTIRNVINGKHKPNGFTINSLASALGIDFDELYESAKYV